MKTNTAVQPKYRYCKEKKEDMCKQAQSICNYDCEHCAWQTERSE